MEHVLLSGPGPPPRLAPAHCSQAQVGWGECAGARELTKESTLLGSRREHPAEGLATVPIGYQDGV